MNRRKKSSSHWRKTQTKDHYVREANRLGVRSRSYFKLEEIDRKYKLFKKGQAILDLGASPGGWSQYVASKVAPEGTVYAIDLLEMKPIDDVQFIQCDITKLDSQQALHTVIAKQQIDIVLSDMAPNITGNAVIDQRNYTDIYDSIYEVCNLTLRESGTLVFKFFQNSESRNVQIQFKRVFSNLKVIKPSASRSKSQESYMLGKGFVTSRK